jgi:hypothetical protein
MSAEGLTVDAVALMQQMMPGAVSMPPLQEIHQHHQHQLAHHVTSEIQHDLHQQEHEPQQLVLTRKPHATISQKMSWCEDYEENYKGSRPMSWYAENIIKVPHSTFHRVMKDYESGKLDRDNARTNYTIEQKLTWARDYEENWKGKKSIRWYAASINVPKTIFHRALKEYEEGKLENSGTSPFNQVFQHAKYPDFEQKLCEFLAQNKDITYSVLKDVAKEMARLTLSPLELETFKCSTGWLNGFLHRHGLSVEENEEVVKACKVLLRYAKATGDKDFLLDMRAAQKVVQGHLKDQRIVPMTENPRKVKKRAKYRREGPIMKAKDSLPPSQSMPSVQQLQDIDHSGALV